MDGQSNRKNMITMIYQPNNTDHLNGIIDNLGIDVLRGEDLPLGSLPTTAVSLTFNRWEWESVWRPERARIWTQDVITAMKRTYGD